jgi:hypothetical protein
MQFGMARGDVIVVLRAFVGIPYQVVCMDLSGGKRTLWVEAAMRIDYVKR